MKRRSVDILVVIAITIIATVLVFIMPSNDVAGRILTLPLVFILPGYALNTALFPEQALEMPKCLVFILGLSLVIVVLGGLVLNLTTFGLRSSSWAVYLSSITLGACIIALVRRRKGNVPVSGLLRAVDIGFTFRQGLLMSLAVLIVCGAFAVSIIGAKHQPYPGATQLWILPADGAKAQNAVNLGVSNMESTTMAYRLAVTVNGKVVEEWPSIALKPNEQWNTTLALSQLGYTGTAKVEADLYRANAPTTVYRHVVLWLGSTALTGEKVRQA